MCNKIAGHSPANIFDLSHPAEDLNQQGGKVVSSHRRGDVAAYSYRYSDATGHSAIVVGRGFSVGTSGTYRMISRTPFGFSNNTHYLPSGAQYVYRRYVGR